MNTLMNVVNTTLRVAAVGGIVWYAGVLAVNTARVLTGAI